MRMWIMLLIYFIYYALGCEMDDDLLVVWILWFVIGVVWDVFELFIKKNKS